MRGVAFKDGGRHAAEVTRVQEHPTANLFTVVDRLRGAGQLGGDAAGSEIEKLRRCAESFSFPGQKQRILVRDARGLVPPGRLCKRSPMLQGPADAGKTRGRQGFQKVATLQSISLVQERSESAEYVRDGIALAIAHLHKALGAGKLWRGHRMEQSMSPDPAQRSSVERRTGASG